MTKRPCAPEATIVLSAIEACAPNSMDIPASVIAAIVLPAMRPEVPSPEKRMPNWPLLMRLPGAMRTPLPYQTSMPVSAAWSMVVFEIEVSASST